ncbi:hypothetical protein A1355_14650 [Methylomonas koyamae]|uniref:Uncharacterized protein n=1 Tax=Methylomonas koyamae TaxID=702114 RepID=A0A177N2P4_9GAMM|nr:hypothetical protein A1355_14650 [Methylomonas koyamae]
MAEVCGKSAKPESLTGGLQALPAKIGQLSLEMSIPVQISHSNNKSCMVDDASHIHPTALQNATVAPTFRCTARDFRPLARSGESSARSNGSTVRSGESLARLDGSMVRSGESLARSDGSTVRSGGPLARSNGSTLRSAEPLTPIAGLLLGAAEPLASTVECCGRFTISDAEFFQGHRSLQPQLALLFARTVRTPVRNVHYGKGVPRASPKSLP